eukprot:4840111-Amphidinium_carterae.1
MGGSYHLNKVLRGSVAVSSWTTQESCSLFDALEVELSHLQFDTPTAMSADRKLEVARDLQLQGNSSAREGKYEEAAEWYLGARTLHAGIITVFHLASHSIHGGFEAEFES